MQELEEALGIPQIIVSEILTEDLGKKRVTAKFVSWVLSHEQKEFHAKVTLDLLETTNKKTHISPKRS